MKEDQTSATTLHTFILCSALSNPISMLMMSKPDADLFFWWTPRKSAQRVWEQKQREKQAAGLLPKSSEASAHSTQRPGCTLERLTQSAAARGHALTSPFTTVPKPGAPARGDRANACVGAAGGSGDEDGQCVSSSLLLSRSHAGWEDVLHRTAAGAPQD